VSAAPAQRAAQTPAIAAPPATDNLVGLALSGGGIRSATFALGALQALHKLGLLALFDYVSTVSGGGFTGAWWSAWLSRAERRPSERFPEAEDIEPSRRPSTLLLDPDSPRPSAEIWTARDPIHHLRLFANYLTPRRGALSADYLARGHLLRAKPGLQLARAVADPARRRDARPAVLRRLERRRRAGLRLLDSRRRRGEVSGAVDAV
jgi:patatin-like phospholipase